MQRINTYYPIEEKSGVEIRIVSPFKWVEWHHLKQTVMARDAISHVIDCVVIKLACPDIYLSESVRIEDAYQQSDLDKMKQLAVVFNKAWRVRKILLGK